MLDQLISIENRFEELNLLLSEPAVFADQERYRKLVSELAELSNMVDLIRSLRDVRKSLEEHRQMLYQTDDREFRDLIRTEINELEAQEIDLDAKLEDELIPKDPKDSRNVIIEIRAGAGGDEAGLFAAVLYRMYSAYAETQGWKSELIDLNETEIGGFKEVVFMIEGRGSYSQFKFESGVHRVQRVPVTESGGRIHTSTVTVAVLPEAEDVEVSINPNDLQIDTYRASGAGGQHVNKTDSAVRITHKPTGLVVTCQDQRSQYKNKDRAMAVLKSRLLEMTQAAHAGAIASDRKSQVGTGDRSERIRTYNYHQGRVTDHRIGLTLYRLESILQGDIGEIIKALQTASRTGNLNQAAEED